MEPAIQGRARLTNKRLLSLLLLSQLRGDWLEEKRTEFLSRAVCSDWQVKTGGARYFHQAEGLLREVRLSFGCFKPTRSLGLGLKAVQQGAKGSSGLTTLPNDK